MRPLNGIPLLKGVVGFRRSTRAFSCLFSHLLQLYTKWFKIFGKFARNFLYIGQVENSRKIGKHVFRNILGWSYLHLHINFIHMCSQIFALCFLKKTKINWFFIPSKRNFKKWLSIWACFSWEKICIPGKKNTIKISMTLLLNYIHVNISSKLHWNWLSGYREKYTDVCWKMTTGEQVSWRRFTRCSR